MSHAQATAVSGQDLQSSLAEARERSGALFQIVRPDALFDRPILERHRIIFYIGHLEAFDWNLICRGAFELPSFHPKFDQLFAFGIDPVDGGLPSDVPSDWPHLDEVVEYNRTIRARVDECLDAAMNGGSTIPANTLQLIHVAIEHRLMHVETLAYMLHQMSYDRKIAPAAPAALPASATHMQPHMVQIPAGTARLGLDITPDAPFGWDNEFAAHTVDVPAFAIDAQNVTNGQFVEFVVAGGYENRSLWSEADWEWKSKAGIRNPSFWTQRSGEWHYRAMFAEIPLPLDWPVYVSHAEASAYARWLDKALPTEAQFHRAAFGTPKSGEREFPWGNSAPAPHHGNFDFARWDPVPVGSHPAGNSAFGVADLVGNGWEWTSTIFEGFTGFQAFPFYPGYSANFFDGKHYVIKGGSPQTAARLLRRSFRNWFQPHYPYIYATFRCVENQME
jgi:ergothioneine biosynthesis protein EgtB